MNVWIIIIILEKINRLIPIMKNQQPVAFASLRNLVMCALMLPLAFTSCKKGNDLIANKDAVRASEESKSKVALQSRNRVMINDVLDQNLNEISNVFLTISKDKSIRGYINRRAAEKFDGENNVLLKDLDVNGDDKNLNSSVNLQIAEKFKQSKGANLSDALLKFKGIQGANFYPHIYIPEYDPAEATKSKFSTPVIVPFNGDDSKKQPYWLGTAYDKDGNKVDSIHVDEEFTKSNEVWVITPNERVDKDGHVRKQYNPQAQKSVQSGSQTSALLGGGPTAKITSMTIKANKESFIKGASEVEMAILISWNDAIKPGTTSYEATYYISDVAPVSPALNTYPTGLKVWGDHNDSTWFGAFTRNEVSSHTPHTNHQIYANLSSFTGWFPNRGDYFYYVIYESDAGGSQHYEYVPTLLGTIPMAVTQLPVVVYSDETPYAMGNIHIVTVPNYIEQNLTSHWVVNNSEIELLGSQL